MNTLILKDLDVHIDTFIFIQEELAWRLSDISYESEEYSEINLNICLNFRRLAIAHLLYEGDLEQFRHYLLKSAETFASFLEVSKKFPNVDQYYLTTGKSEPLFDAVLCSDLWMAEKISDLADHSYSKGEEYEEEFCFYFFIMQLFFLKSCDSEIEKNLLQFESSLKGNITFRYQICLALYTRNTKLFDESLTGIIEERRDTFDDLRQNDIELEEILDTEGYIFIEGMALLKLALLRKMDISKEYLFVPGADRMQDWMNEGQSDLSYMKS